MLANSQLSLTRLLASVGKWLKARHDGAAGAELYLVSTEWAFIGKSGLAGASVLRGEEGRVSV